MSSAAEGASAPSSKAPTDVELSRKSDQTAEKPAAEEQSTSHAEPKKDFKPSEGLTTAGTSQEPAPPCQSMIILLAIVWAPPRLCPLPAWRACLPRVACARVTNPNMLTPCRGRRVAGGMGQERAGGEDHAQVAGFPEAGKFALPSWQS
jgi:hypothetical protein